MTFHQFKRRVRCIHDAATNPSWFSLLLDGKRDELHALWERQNRLEKMAARLFERSRVKV